MPLENIDGSKIAIAPPRMHDGYINASNHSLNVELCFENLRYAKEKICNTG